MVETSDQAEGKWCYVEADACTTDEECEEVETKICASDSACLDQC
jgi:hypothetical protein